MFGRYSKQYWKRKRRSPFGGEVKSMEEVNALSRKILDHEKKESSEADIMLDQELKKL